MSDPIDEMRRKISPFVPIMEYHIKLQQENAALAAENERLRKAGDELADFVADEGTSHAEAAVARWLAAKEGRDAK